ncbi:hypothetical protein [Devosia sp.]|uniref:hypothetical protein n=1 Tax=Devosia sp. TaxID=1871048 RepID=UPI003265272D
MRRRLSGFPFVVVLSSAGVIVAWFEVWLALSSGQIRTRHGNIVSAAGDPILFNMAVAWWIAIATIATAFVLLLLLIIIGLAYDAWLRPRRVWVPKDAPPVDPVVQQKDER